MKNNLLLNLLKKWNIQLKKIIYNKNNIFTY